MGIDLRNERGIPLSAVPNLPWLQTPAGRKPSISSVYRWCLRGIQGRRLEFVQRGGVRVTTEAALVRFFASLTNMSVRGTQPGIAAPQIVT